MDVVSVHDYQQFGGFAYKRRISSHTEYFKLICNEYDWLYLFSFHDVCVYTYLLMSRSVLQILLLTVLRRLSSTRR